MSGKTVVDFVEEWQTGALFVLGSALVGALVGMYLGEPGSGYLGVGGFIVGSVLAFLAFSYLRYGR